MPDRRVAWFAATLLFVAQLATIAWWTAHDELLDLEVYRVGGRAILDGLPLYEARHDPTGLPFTYTPFAGLLFVPLALLRDSVAAWALTAGSLGALARTCWILVRTLERRGPLPAPAGLVTIGLLVAVLPLEPVRQTLHFGQVNLVILWLVVEDLLGAGRRRFGGVLLGLATGIKLVPGIFVGHLVVTDRRPDAARAIGVAALTVLVGALVVWDDAVAYWTGVAYDETRVGDVAYAGNQSLNALLWRSLGRGGSRAAWLALALLVVVAGVASARRLWQAGLPVSSVCAVALAGLLASPISWSHHWVWIVAVLVALVEVARARRPAPGAVGLAVATWVLSATWVIWWPPHPPGPVRPRVGWEHLAVETYTLWAVVLLAWFGWVAVTTRDADPRPRCTPARSGPATRHRASARSSASRP